MANEPRIVVDTGVIVSALLLPRSTPRQAFDLAVRAGRLLLSSQTLAELDEVLRRRKFDPYLTEDDRLGFLAAFVREAAIVDVDAVVTDCRDPRDNKFLELAISGKATHLVTGDADLLTLHPFRGIEILTPAQFLKRVIEES